MNARRASHKLSVPMWARIPVIPGYNDSAEKIEATAKFIVEELRDCVKWISLLTYHWLGETKLERLEANCLVSTSPHSQQYLQELQRSSEGFGLSAYVGG
jgi:pyruvate-formate lyase-activating enzyme